MAKASIDKFNRQTAGEQTSYMENYYKWQSSIYDATRWAFLFGRRNAIASLPLSRETNGHIVEIGCGTGYNLKLLAKRFPQAMITGFDVSPDMIALSQKKCGAFSERVNLRNESYLPGEKQLTEPVDAILFSYSLTMINPQWSALIEQAAKDLKPGGWIAVVDFHDSKQSWFKKHMSNHHVRMDGHLLPKLNKHFQPKIAEVKRAYGGIWEYLEYVGGIPTDK